MLCTSPSFEGGRSGFHSAVHRIVKEAGEKDPAKEAAKSEDATTKISYTTDMAASPPVAITFAGGALQEKAKLLPGLDGFLFAVFSDGRKETFERPNILLEAILKAEGGQGSEAQRKENNEP